MKHQVMFVYSQAFYDEVDSEYDNAFEAACRLKELCYAGFSGSYIKKVKGKVSEGLRIKLHKSPLIAITANGIEIVTGQKLNSKEDAIAFLKNYVILRRGVKYEIRTTQRYEVEFDKLLPIHEVKPQEKFFNKVLDETTGEENYCGGY